MLRSESLTSFIGNTLFYVLLSNILSKNLHVTSQQFVLCRSVGTVFYYWECCNSVKNRTWPSLIRGHKVKTPTRPGSTLQGVLLLEMSPSFPIGTKTGRVRCCVFCIETVLSSRMWTTTVPWQLPNDRYRYRDGFPSHPAEISCNQKPLAAFQRWPGSKVWYQAFSWVLIDLIMELLDLSIKWFDNQTDIFIDLCLIIKPCDNQSFWDIWLIIKSFDYFVYKTFTHK